MKNALELIKALTPFIVAAMPFLMLMGGYWINKQTKKTAAAVAVAQTVELKKATVAQTVELKAHSDENREKTVSAVASVTGTFKALPPTPHDGS